MRDATAGTHPGGEDAADVERPLGHPRPRYVMNCGRSRRQRIWARMAMALVMASQFLVFVIAPIVHARVQCSVGSHVETQGAPQHYIHDEGRCAVCAAHHVPAVVAPLPPALPLSRRYAVMAGPASQDVPRRAHETPTAPRAPPRLVRIV